MAERLGRRTCACAQQHRTRRVVLTGGPGAGKTAVLEMVRRTTCRHLLVLPEAAGVLFGGGFPREESAGSRRAAQRAIFHVQRELEAVGDLRSPAVVLCDRGTVDGLGYWPGEPQEFWDSVGTSLESEQGRYDAVVHLRTPAADHGYDWSNPLRVESAAAAAAVDARIAAAWKGHPRTSVVPATEDFLEKARSAVALIRGELPECCSGHLSRGVASASAMA